MALDFTGLAVIQQKDRTITVRTIDQPTMNVESDNVIIVPASDGGRDVEGTPSIIPSRS